MRFYIFILFFFCAKLVAAQAEDSTEVVLDSYDTTIYYEDSEEEYDEPYSTSTYTKTPQELSPTQQERNKRYTEKKFSKTEWKKIVGNTNYAEDPEKKEKQDEEEKGKSPAPGRSPVWDGAILKILGYLVIFGLIGAAIFFLFRNTMLDKAVIKSKLNIDPLFYEASHIDEINETDLERLLREALERNDLRSAVRLYYIRLLKELHSSGHIAWKKDKTNYDYAHELSAAPFIPDFRRLMIAYEIIWYGERTPSPEEFKKLQSGFDDLHGRTTRTS